MANASYPRAERVRRAIQEVLADELEEMSDPGLGLVTITEVTLSPDMRNARVFYTVYPDVTRAATKDAMKRATGHLRTAIAREIRLRRTPQIELVEDPIPERTARLDQVFSDIHRADKGEDA